MSNEETLYTGADRGTFKVMRLIDDRGVQLRVKARIKEVAVYNYISDMQYAIIGYKIEWWKETAVPPYAGGEEGNLYLPRGRSNLQTLFMRTKPAAVSKILHLEDAIINDFLMEKVLEQSEKLNDFTSESKEQRASSAIWREATGTPMSYKDGVHITHLTASESGPLEVISEAMTFKLRLTGDEGDGAQISKMNVPFVSIKECINQIIESARTM